MLSIQMAMKIRRIKNNISRLVKHPGAVRTTRQHASLFMPRVVMKMSPIIKQHQIMHRRWWAAAARHAQRG